MANVIRRTTLVRRISSIFTILGSKVSAKTAGETSLFDTLKLSTTASTTKMALYGRRVSAKVAAKLVFVSLLGQIAYAFGAQTAVVALKVIAATAILTNRRC